MASNQQFCLRWNNHQSTLISVFDHLLESGTLVDCTLAAEGQFLKAHKVVLSACSPYLEVLLSQHYEKHPILILKDVSFHELKSMLDYMYRGEVNISQEQLGTFLKAAESLQIKGLTDCGAMNETHDLERSREMEHGRTSSEFNRVDRSLGSALPKRIDVRKQIPIHPRPRSPLVGLPANFVMNADHRRVNKHQLPQDGNLGTSNVIRNREGSLSPTIKRKRPTSYVSQNEDPSVPSPVENNVDQNHHQQKSEKIQNASPVPQSLSNSVPVSSKISETKKQSESENSVDSEVIKREVKMENVDFTDEVQNEDSVEDLTVDEEEEEMDEMDLSQPGPSTASNSLVAGVPWHNAGEGNGDDGLLASQHDSQDKRPVLPPGKLLILKKVKHRVGVFCNDCGSGSRNNGMVIHKDSCPKMQKNELFQCQCGDIFSTRKALTMHRIACRAPVPFKLKPKMLKCDRCGKSFSSKITHSLHVNSCTYVPGLNMIVVCKCGKECKSMQGLSNHKRYCTRPVTPDELKGSSTLLGKGAERKDVKKSKSVERIKDEKPKASERGGADVTKRVENSGDGLTHGSNEKKRVTDKLSFDDGDNSTNASEIAKEIVDDFHSELSTPTTDDELKKPVDLGDRLGKKDEDDDEYCRHLPLNPVSTRQETQVKTNNKKTPEKEPMTINSSSSSMSGTPKKKMKREADKSPIQGSSGIDSEKKPLAKKQKLRCKCGAAFKTKIAYTKHKTILCKIKMLRCNWCPFQTRLKTSMRNHVIERHSDVLLNILSDSTSE